MRPSTQTRVVPAGAGSINQATVRRRWTRPASWILFVAGGCTIGLAFVTHLDPATRAAVILSGIAIVELGGAIALSHNRAVRNALSDAGKPIGVIAGLALAAIYVSVTLAGNPFVRDHFFELGGLKLAAIPIAIGAASCEEMVFRTLLMDRLARRGFGTAIQITISGLAFGLAHFYAFAGLGSAFSAQLLTTLLGLGLASVYVLAGRKLLPAIVSHCVVDLAIEPWLIAGFFLR